MNNDTLYKAVRPDGTDFHTGTVQWAPPEGHEGEWIVRHPTATEIGDHAREYLSVSTVATDCTGMVWPCRLLTVEAVGGVITPTPFLPRKRAGITFRVTGERDAHEAFGPQGEAVAALIVRAGHLTASEMQALDVEWDVVSDIASGVASDIASDIAWGAGRHSSLSSASYAVRDTLWDAAPHAARALVVRDLITTDHYDILTRTWREIIGPIHPDDPDMKGTASS